jgi:uncharacterized repeat protein (TIGR03833 family)
MKHTKRNNIHIGLMVDVIQKQDQQSGERTRGNVSKILTNSMNHPHGIKVRLENGIVGRVIEIIED